MDTLISLVVVFTAPCMHMSKHHLVHLKYTQSHFSKAGENVPGMKGTGRSDPLVRDALIKRTDSEMSEMMALADRNTEITLLNVSYI